MNIPLTNHAAARIQQRGIQLGVIEFIVAYGREVHCGGGCVKMMIGKRERKRVLKDKGETPEIKRLLDKAAGRYIVEATGGVLVTAAQSTRRVRLDCKSAREASDIKKRRCSKGRSWERSTNYEI